MTIISTIILLCLLSYIGHANDSFFFNEETDKCTGDNCGTDDEKINSIERETPTTTSTQNNDAISVMITFTNAKSNDNLQTKFRQTVHSLLKHSSTPLVIYIIGDDDSQQIASNILQEYPSKDNTTYKVVPLNVNSMAKKLDHIIHSLKKHFSAHKYYSLDLFFLSVAMHKVMPENVRNVIMLDADLKFMADVKELHDRFELFEEENVIGIAREMQPVYKHLFWQYRSENKGTRVGEPRPNGLTGFNSGVLMLDLHKMRTSELYNSLISSDSIDKLVKEFHFKGHLGDQDFYTLINMKYEQLFHVIPCEWNRQLCRWWFDKGYADIFHLYFDCNTQIKIYHGNCNTPIPSE